MSPTDSGADLNTTSAKTIEGQGQDKGADKSQVIKSEANQSLFMDSIDPRFRPNATDLQVIQDKRQLGPPMGPPVDSPLTDSNAQNADTRSLPPLFKDDGPKMSYQEFINSYRPGDLNFPGRQPGIMGYRPYGVPYDTNQRYSDQAADQIFPGFGRIEGTAGSDSWRIDYLSGKNCHMKRLGICFSMQLH